MIKRIDLGWATIIAAFLTGLLSLGMSAYIQATHSDVADHAKALETEHRMTAVESKVDGQRQQVDHIQTQVDKLVEWALGSK